MGRLGSGRSIPKKERKERLKALAVGAAAGTGFYVAGTSAHMQDFNRKIADKKKETW